MSFFSDVANKVGQLGKDYILLTERVARLEKLIDSQGETISALRKENSDLTERVAVLEEGRRTTASDVKLALTEAIAGWEMQKLREENERLRRGQLPPSQT